MSSSRDLLGVAWTGLIARKIRTLLIMLGPIVGASVWLLLEELLSSTRFGLPWGLDDMLHDHWMLVLGVFVVIVTLALKQGLYGWLLEREE